MKFPSFLLAVLLAWSVALADAASYRSFVAPDVVQGDLRGKVKRVQEKTTEQRDGIEVPTWEGESVYDPSGYLEKRWDTNMIDGETATTKRFYDTQGDLIAEEETIAGRTVRKTIRLLPERKGVIWETEVDGRKTTLAETTFDRFGKEGEGRDFGDKGEATSHFKTNRNAEGLEVEVTFSDGQGELETIVKVTWDSRGFMVADEHDNRAEKIQVKTSHEYPEVDAQGNWTKQISTKVYSEKGLETMTDQDVTTRVFEYY